MAYLFNLLNDSIFAKPAPSDHKCHENQCSGTRLHGLKINCNRCENDYFFDCMASRSEVKSLLGLLNYQDKNNVKQVKKAETKLNEILHIDSVFEFVCPSCKTNASYSDQKAIYESRIEEFTSQIAQLKKEIASAKSSATKANNAKDKSLKQSIENSETIKSQTQLISELQNRVSSLELIIGDVKKVVSEQLSNGKILSSLLNQCVSHLNKNEESMENARKSLEIPSSSSSYNDASESTTDDQSEFNSGENISKQTDDLTRNTTDSDQKSLSPENAVPIIDADLYVSNNVPDNMILRPPKTKPKPPMTTYNSIFEIYASKFDHSMTCEEISSYIVNNTTLENSEQFNVMKIKHKSCAAFKITVLKKDVFDLIMDERIWSPNFNACLFDNAKVKNTSEQNKIMPQKQNLTDSSNKVKSNNNRLLQQSKKTYQNLNMDKRHYQNVNKQRSVNSFKPSNRAAPPVMKQSRIFNTNTQSIRSQSEHMNPAPVVYAQAPSLAPYTSQQLNGNFWYSHNGLHQPQYSQNLQLNPVYTHQNQNHPLYSHYIYPTH